MLARIESAQVDLRRRWRRQTSSRTSFFVEVHRHEIRAIFCTQRACAPTPLRFFRFCAALHIKNTSARARFGCLPRRRLAIVTLLIARSFAFTAALRVAAALAHVQPRLEIFSRFHSFLASSGVVVDVVNV